jgi:Anti-sigma-28 factor, FlgM
MDQDGEKVTEIKHRIERGEYRVDPRAVADALLRRLRESAQGRPEHLNAAERALADELFRQIECSYPASSPGASVNATPARPSSTRPTQVRPTVLKRSDHMVSIALRALAGTHTQSS